MFGIVVVSHGGLGEQFVAAAEHILGPQGQLSAISITDGEDLDASRERLRQAIKDVNTGHGVVMLTDMFGGTPSNLAISLLEESHCEVVAGVNLPMIIKLLQIRAQTPLTEAVLQAQDSGRKYIHVASKLLKAHG
ncbi:MAG: PTS sugar transporter subunit IIA [Holosporales bacterium]